MQHLAAGGHSEICLHLFCYSSVALEDLVEEETSDSLYICIAYTIVRSLKKRNIQEKILR